MLRYWAVHKGVPVMPRPSLLVTNVNFRRTALPHFLIISSDSISEGLLTLKDIGKERDVTCCVLECIVQALSAICSPGSDGGCRSGDRKIVAKKKKDRRNGWNSGPETYMVTWDEQHHPLKLRDHHDCSIGVGSANT